MLLILHVVILKGGETVMPLIDVLLALKDEDSFLPRTTLLQPLRLPHPL